MSCPLAFWGPRHCSHARARHGPDAAVDTAVASSYHGALGRHRLYSDRELGIFNELYTLCLLIARHTHAIPPTS